jgi:DHA2 family multidrug resistance protein-like MFS transporter
MTLAPDGLPVRERRRAALVIILGIVMTALDGNVVTLALPAIARDLQVSPASSVWVINAFQLAALCMLLPWAAVGDRWGYRRVYLVGVALFLLGSSLCLVADSLPRLAGARALQGVGAAGVMAVNGALVQLVYPRAMFGRGLALNSGMVAVSSVAGPSIAAAILSVASWPWLFGPSLGIGPLVLALGWTALPDNAASAPQGERPTLADVLLNALMFGLFFLGAQSLSERAGSMAQQVPAMFGLVLLAGGFLVGVVHLRRQRRRAVPLVPLDLLRIPVFRLSMCVSIGAFAAQTVAFISLPFLLLGSWQRSAAEAGLLMSLWPLAVFAIVPVAGRMIGRYPGGLLGGAGMAVFGLGLALLALLPGVPSTLDIAWRMMLCGLGFGLFQSPNNHTILTSAPANRSGAAGGMLGTARLTGQTLGAVLIVHVFSLAGPDHGHGPVLALALAACSAFVAGTFSVLRISRPVQSR